MRGKYGRIRPPNPPFPPQPSLWITDELLNEALHRFTRVSIVARHESACRNYSVNVPGPLEAQRRLSRRRMGLNAASGAGSFAAPDPTVLFGLGQSMQDQNSWKTMFKWESPTSKAKKRPTQVGSIEIPSWMAPDYTPAKSARLHNLAPDPSPDADAVAVSRCDFEALLSGKSLMPLEEDTLVDIIQFLQGSRDEPGAGNLPRAFQWLAMQLAPEAALNALVNVVLERIKLDVLTPDSISDILQTMLSLEQTEIVVSAVQKVLHALEPASSYREICASVTRFMCQKALADGAKQATKSLAQLHLWLDCVRSCNHTSVPLSQDLTWRSIHQELATHLSISNLAPHFAQMRHPDLALILLEYWVPEIISDSRSDAESRDKRSFVQLKGTMQLGRPVFHTPPAMGDLIQELNRLSQDVPDCHRVKEGSLRYQGSTLVHLLSVLHKFQIPYNGLARDIFTILRHETSANGAAARVFHTLSKHPELGIDSEMARSLVEHFLSRDEIRYAYSVFTTATFLPFRDFPHLAIKIASSNEIKSPSIWNVLLRKAPADQSFEPDPANATCHISPLRVKTVHEVANICANAPHLPWRQAWRRVWECYRYLRDRHAPIYPELAHAMVKAGVIRPMQHKRGPSTEGFRYIRGIVSRVEGESVAVQLDSLVYRIWSTTILPGIRTRNLNRAAYRGASKVIEEVRGMVPFKRRPWHEQVMGNEEKWLNLWHQVYSKSWRNGNQPFTPGYHNVLGAPKASKQPVAPVPYNASDVVSLSKIRESAASPTRDQHSETAQQSTKATTDHSKPLHPTRLRNDSPMLGARLRFGAQVVSMHQEYQPSDPIISHSPAWRFSSGAPARHRMNNVNFLFKPVKLSYALEAEHQTLAGEPDLSGMPEHAEKSGLPDTPKVIRDMPATWVSVENASSTVAKKPGHSQASPPALPEISQTSAKPAELQDEPPQDTSAGTVAMASSITNTSFDHNKLHSSPLADATLLPFYGRKRERRVRSSTTPVLNSAAGLLGTMCVGLEKPGGFASKRVHAGS